jgi:hypothetical protein
MHIESSSVYTKKYLTTDVIVRIDGSMGNRVLTTKGGIIFEDDAACNFDVDDNVYIFRIGDEIHVHEHPQSNFYYLAFAHADARCSNMQHPQNDCAA